MVKKASLFSRIADRFRQRGTLVGEGQTLDADAVLAIVTAARINPATVMKSDSVTPREGHAFGRRHRG